MANHTDTLLIDSVVKPRNIEKSLNLNSKLANYKLVIFDWDGTLMDSIDRIVSSMQAAAKHCLLTIPSIEQVKGIIGLSFPQAFELLFPEASSPKITEVFNRYRHEYLECDSTPAPLFDNALSLLTKLNENNRLVAVATGKSRPGLERVFKATQTAHFFHASRTADEANSKPDPDMLISLLAELNINPKHAVMIGDTSYDMAMAQAAGVDSIGITLGVHDETILNNYQPVAIVNSMFELEQLLLPQF
ncbi:HAD-IA family hydrolase [Colwellia echini]|uniref:HAD-IA family hydrolase n=1 Tax=Colwellia echini TaxID=1982103 RepID=A0ABY3MZY0_9GAMM|nr:HAD-IA family hydrolase [Colwellia echini]TYK66783.1 HAD-IA family hydrolase [Colwellia echini]